MKHSIVLFVAFFTTIITYAQNGIVGKWWSPEKDGQIEIYVSNGKYYGKIIWGKTPSNDTKNPNPALRNKPLIGSTIFNDFVWDKNNYQWIDGTIYDPNNGKTYDAKIWLSKDGNTMHVRGFIGISLLGRTEKFERIKS